MRIVWQTAVAAAALILIGTSTAAAQDGGGAAALKVFLDCDDCFADYIREDVDMVEYVRDPLEADVHIIVTESATASGGVERAVSFVGVGPLAGVDILLRAITEAGDSEVTERRRLATTITIGLLTYLSRGGAIADLDVSAARTSPGPADEMLRDPWKQWVLSLSGSVSLEGEETSRETRANASVGADRITDDWKVTLGGQLEYERQRFDLDDEDPLLAVRREQSFDGLVVRGLDEHWSVGGRLAARSSTFDNVALAYSVRPAIEFNVFPYAAYTRRQLRLNYSIGPYRARYVEETLFGRLEETLVEQVISATLEQREPWGSIEAGINASNYLPGLARHRFELEGDLAFRLARGLSLTVEGSASRLRDQLNLPKRGATPEEVLLELREVQTGYEYELEIGLRYTFGSIFSAIVNPRFGQ